MTIASEITRLQGAKADIKTSIENKGVTVPSSTKLDDYAPYIDQIDTGGAFMDALSLKEYRVDTYDWTPNVEGFISRNTTSKYYSAILLHYESSSSPRNNYYTLVGATKQTGGDMQYNKGVGSASSSHGRPSGIRFYKKVGAIRCFFYENSGSTVNPIHRWRCDWNLGTNAITVVNFDNNDSTNFPSSADTTGYTETTENSWVNTVTGTNTNDDTNIYITTK